MGPERVRIDGKYASAIFISWSLINGFFLWSAIKDPSTVCPPEAMCFFLGLLYAGVLFYLLGYPVVAVCLVPGFVLAADVIRRVRRWQLLCWVPAWVVIGATPFLLLGLIFLPMNVAWVIGLLSAVFGLMCGISYLFIASLVSR
jgi:hypothetical protein